MRTHIAAALSLALAAFAVLPAEAAAPSSSKACQSPAERSAENVRQLQTAFMVAALKCRNHPDANLTDSYNAFIRKYSDELLRQSNVLQGYFKRQYGGSHLKRFDSYITQLANEVSRTSQTVPQYCQSMKPVLAAVMSVEPKNLGGFESNLPEVRTSARSPKCPQEPSMKTAAAEAPSAASSAPAPSAKAVAAAAPAPAKPSPSKPATAKPAPAKPAPAKPAANVAAKAPAAEKAPAQTASAQPAAAQPAAAEPSADKPSADKPSADKTAADKPATENPPADKAAPGGSAIGRAAAKAVAKTAQAKPATAN